MLRLSICSDSGRYKTRAGANAPALAVYSTVFFYLLPQPEPQAAQEAQPG